ncbi:hypothetical protein AOQ71_18160 [Bradyrhizobium manausense]|uniref:Uncharacterized protein n=2 Tax=Bradyrhizobium manausense TaxID=989370 RepID=A0A0R3DNH2_9BRAD|nr:hypothetical protein AOQ71_18160 [Bradyrhizobium manausense]
MVRKVVVTFDEHDFEQLEMLAKLRKISIAEEIRRMCRAQLDYRIPYRIRRQVCDERLRSRRRLPLLRAVACGAGRASRARAVMGPAPEQGHGPSLNREQYAVKGARTVVCPAKAGMFSRRQTCLG